MARGRDEHEARNGTLQSFGKALAKRAKSCCELCGTNTSLSIVEVPPVAEPELERCVLLCETCRGQVEKPTSLDAQHWYCLNESAWSETPAVQVLAWRLLNALTDQGWAQDLLEQIYLEPEVQAWAASGSKAQAGDLPRDSNGTILEDGDSVHIIKDLDVKGTSFVAKRGTLVKNIRVGSDPELVEGRVNKTQIMLKTAFLKKVT